MRILLILSFWLLGSVAWGQDRNPLMPEPNSLFLRIMDTGSGTATLTIVTGDTNRDKHVMIYDGGHWFDDPLMIAELRHYLGTRKKVIDLLIISHSDSDHLGAADTVLQFWKVRKNVRTGWSKNRPGTYWAYRRELEKSVDEKGTEDFVIGDGSPSLGETWTLGDARVTFLSGFGALPSGWVVGVPSTESKSRNAVSIVVRVDYGNRSILLPGDAVGRQDDKPWNQIIGTEKFLFDNRQARSIRADILLAPHHGADNGSSLPFIEAVEPTWVIFSAGAAHKHPKFNTFRRYESFGVPVAQILRTDRGDMKGRPTEWWGDWDDSCRDGRGDDGISILIRKSNQEIVVDQDPVVDPAKGC